MARICIVIALLAAGFAVGQPNRAQQCIPLGGPLVGTCSEELKYLEQPSNYPLTSTSPPTDEQVNTLVSNLPSNLPSQACCAAVQKFDSAGCGCEASLSQSLSAVGLESTPTGLAGVSKIAATACKFPPYQC